MLASPTVCKILLENSMEICDLISPNIRCTYLFSCHVDFTVAARL